MPLCSKCLGLHHPRQNAPYDLFHLQKQRLLIFTTVQCPSTPPTPHPQKIENANSIPHSQCRSEICSGQAQERGLFTGSVRSVNSVFLLFVCLFVFLLLLFFFSSFLSDIRTARTECLPSSMGQLQAAVWKGLLSRSSS